MIAFSKPRKATLDGYKLECPKGDWNGQALTIPKLLNQASFHATMSHHEGATFDAAAKPKKAKQLRGSRAPAAKKHAKASTSDRKHQARRHKRSSDLSTVTPHPQAPKIEPLTA